jgi:hypothetical protein
LNFKRGKKDQGSSNLSSSLRKTMAAIVWTQTWGETDHGSSRLSSSSSLKRKQLRVTITQAQVQGERV